MVNEGMLPRKADLSYDRRDWMQGGVFHSKFLRLLGLPTTAKTTIDDDFILSIDAPRGCVAYPHPKIVQYLDEVGLKGIRLSKNIGLECAAFALTDCVVDARDSNITLFVGGAMKNAEITAQSISLISANSARAAKTKKVVFIDSKLSADVIKFDLRNVVAEKVVSMDTTFTCESGTFIAPIPMASCHGIRYFLKYLYETKVFRIIFGQFESCDVKASSPDAPEVLTTRMPFAGWRNIYSKQ